jgi:putative ABC transport system substrate-binding protein
MNVPEPLFFQERVAIADLCIDHRLPASFGAAEFAEAGALIGYGVDFSAMYRRAASLVDRILRGARPSTIPVELANSYELVLNLKTARAINVELPRSLLLQSSRVIR